ncbi:hypothetical protein [Acidithiobacillus ferrivorans]|uniref:hypothetical protein n=1 Tax=Acidithiobacillus ferrivorans TaxID=160808 RepID=UPI000A5B6B2D|nr:hypothetical protein [Acidithiobacillus ferrivorans]
MESPHLIFLKSVVNNKPASSEKLRDALHRLDHMLTDLTNDLRVTYGGPYVGLNHTPRQHLICVAEQQWSLQVGGRDLHEPSCAWMACRMATGHRKS